MNNLLKNWYILYTKEGFEKKISNTLTRKNIENFYPVNRQWNAKRRTITEPILNGQIFVYISDEHFSLIKANEGVINFAYWLGKPAIINISEIEMLKSFTTEYSNIKVEKIPFGYQENLKIDILSNGSGGTVQNVSIKNNVVKVTLPSLGYHLTAEMEKSNVEILTTKKNSFGILDKFQFAV